MSETGALVNNFDYSQWYAEQEYLPGAYPSLDDLTFLGWSDRAQYTSCLRCKFILKFNLQVVQERNANKST